jgi:hypothetical protein
MGGILPDAALIGVVIVVPTLTHGEDREKPIVAGIISGHIALSATHMRKRVDAESSVIEQYRAAEEAHHKAGPASDEKAQDGEYERRQLFEPMQPQELRIAGQIGNFRQIGGIVLARENPADVAIDEAFVAR